MNGNWKWFEVSFEYLSKKSNGLIYTTCRRWNKVEQALAKITELEQKLKQYELKNDKNLEESY